MYILFYKLGILDVKRVTTQFAHAAFHIISAR